MNPIPPETDLETLRQMTGAPSPDEPLVSPDTFADLEVQSVRPAWKMPLPRLLLIGAALMPVFGLAGLFLTGSRQTSLRVQPPSTSASKATPEHQERQTGEELEQLRQDNARLQANAALDGQGMIQERLENTQPQSEPELNVPSAPPPDPMPVATMPIAPPETINYRPSSIQSTPSIQVASSPTPRTVSSVNRPSDTTPQRDPIEQWQQLAQLGSYGAIAAPEIITPGLAGERTVEELPVASVPSAQVIPASTSRFSKIPYQTLELPSPVEEVEPEIISTPVEPEDPFVVSLENTQTENTAIHPPILENAEAAILQSQPLPSFLITGTHSAGRLDAPILLDNPQPTDRFAITLSEPLRDHQGNIAIPSGSKLLVQVDRVSETGLVELSASQVVWEVEGQQQELRLPPGAIVIRGEDGDPLIAEQYGDPSAEIAAMDASQFVIGAIGGAAELYTRSDTRIQTGDGSTVVTEENPAPNLLAGALEGGTDALLDTITERNQRAIERIETRPTVAYIKAGTEVQVFVNQSIQLPM